MKKKNPNAVALGKLGAAAQHAALTPEERKAQAKKAIQARWAKHFAENPQSEKPNTVWRRERRAQLKREKGESET